MPVHSIVLLELSVRHYPTSTYGHVSNFGPGRYDLMELWLRFAADTASAGGDVDHERYLLPQNISAKPSNREARLEIEAGSTGERQNVRNTSTGARTASIGTGDSATAPLRSLVEVPAHGRVAFMALEMAGRRSVTGHLSTSWKRHFRQATTGSGFVLDIRNLNDEAAWDDFVSQADLLEVSFQKTVRPAGDRSAQPRVEEYIVRPSGGALLPKSWISRLRSRDIRPQEVLSVNIGDPEVVKIVVETDGRPRTLRIGDSLPTFTYEIDPGSTKRPTSSRFYAVARELIDGQLNGPFGSDPRSSFE